VNKEFLKKFRQVRRQQLFGWLNTDLARVRLLNEYMRIFDRVPRKYGGC
jgi:hypothetical protein